MIHGLREPSALGEYMKRKDEHAKRIADEVMDACEKRFEDILPEGFCSKWSKK